MIDTIDFELLVTLLLVVVVVVEVVVKLYLDIDDIHPNLVVIDKAISRG